MESELPRIRSSGDRSAVTSADLSPERVRKAMADEVEDDSAERSLFPLERERWSDALCAVDHRREIARRAILDIDSIDDLRTSDVP
jgi:hypothetical protein